MANLGMGTWNKEQVFTNRHGTVITAGHAKTE